MKVWGYYITTLCLVFSVIPSSARLTQQSAIGIDPAVESSFPPTAFDDPKTCTEMVTSSFSATGQKGTYWPQSSTLVVKFLNGSPYVQNKVREYASLWTRYANLKFRFVTSGTAEIRVTFKHHYNDGGNDVNDGGSWSWVGKEALKVTDQNVPTVNFGWFDEGTREDDFRGTTLHEFGHVLGMIHEHESPAAEIKWNKPLVYDYYRRVHGWDKALVDHNIFQKYTSAQTQFTQYDPTSIMHYPVPPQLLEPGGTAVNWNSQLSESDKIFVASKYPRLTIQLYKIMPDSQASVVDPDDIPLRLKTGDKFRMEFASPFNAYLYAIARSAEGSFLVHPLSLAQADAKLITGQTKKLQFGVNGTPGTEDVILILSSTKINSPQLNDILSAANGRFKRELMKISDPTDRLPSAETLGVVSICSCNYIKDWVGTLFGLSCDGVQQTVELLKDSSNSQLRVAADLADQPIILRVSYLHVD